MDEQKIYVVYRADGSVERHVVNAPGGACEQLTEAYRLDDQRHGRVSVTETDDAEKPCQAIQEAREVLRVG